MKSEREELTFDNHDPIGRLVVFSRSVFVNGFDFMDITRHVSYIYDAAVTNSYVMLSVYKVLLTSIY